MSELKWHKFPDEKPEEEQTYITCNKYGKIVIRRWARKHRHVGIGPDSYWEPYGEPYFTNVNGAPGKEWKHIRHERRRR